MLRVYKYGSHCVYIFSGDRNVAVAGGCNQCDWRVGSGYGLIDGVKSKGEDITDNVDLVFDGPTLAGVKLKAPPTLSHDEARLSAPGNHQVKTYTFAELKQRVGVYTVRKERDPSYVTLSPGRCRLTSMNNAGLIADLGEARGGWINGDDAKDTSDKYDLVFDGPTFKGVKLKGPREYTVEEALKSPGVYKSMTHCDGDTRFVVALNHANIYMGEGSTPYTNDSLYKCYQPYIRCDDEELKVVKKGTK